MASPEDFNGTDAERFSQMLSVPGEHTASGEYSIDEPIVVTADVSLDCRGAVFHGDSLSRGGSAPDTLFRVANQHGRCQITGGEFRNGNLISIAADLSELVIDIDKFIQDDQKTRIVLIPQSSEATRTQVASVRVRYASDCNLILSTTFGGTELTVQFDLVERLAAYGCRTRPAEQEYRWQRITMRDSEFVGNITKEEDAIRIFQCLVADGGVSRMINVTAADIVCDGLVSFAYWSTGDLQIERCLARNITSAGNERLIESKSTDNAMLSVVDSEFDQSEVDPIVSQNPIIDAKERRVLVHNNRFRGCTSSCLKIAALDGYRPYDGIRQFDSNVVENHRGPSIVDIQSAAPGESVGAVVVRGNTVPDHRNPAGQLQWGATTTALIHVQVPNASAAIDWLHVEDNVYASEQEGDCCLIRVNQYDAAVKPTNFKVGHMVRSISLVNNTCRLPGGWIMNWRNATPTGTIMSDRNAYLGLAGYFGSDVRSTQPCEPPGYRRMSRVMAVPPASVRPALESLAAEKYGASRMSVVIE